MSEPKFITRKGGTVLLYNGHQYYKNSTYKNEMTLWRCTLYKKLKCKGFLTMKNLNVVKIVAHQCPSDPVKNEVDLAMADLKVNVTKSDEPIPKLFSDTVGNLLDGGLNLVTHVPKLKNIQHGLYSARNNNLGVKKIICKKPAMVKVPKQFDNFVLAEYEGKNRILIFCSQKTKGIISDINEIFFDATYQSCPKPFYQLFTVHGKFGSTTETTNVIPLIYVLMSNKTQKSYSIVFQLIQKELAWIPLIVHCDHERASINAILKIFPGVKVVGCYYHWSRCVWRQAKKLGNTKLAVQRRIIALCAKLPLMSYEAINEAWLYIKAESLNTEMDAFFNYFEKNWINSSYSQYISVFGQRHRTNNVVESWNSKINRSLNRSTVNILRLLNYLEKTDKYNPKTSNKRKRDDIKKDDAIVNIQLELLNNEIVIGHALEKLANIK